MKKIYILGMALMGLFSVNAQIIDDNMESYPEGSYFGGHWSNWSLASGSENLLITSAYASSGTKSGAINTDGQDVILLLDPVFQGVYTFQWKMLVPQDKSAWIAFMEDATALAEDPMPLKLNFNTNTDIGGTNYDNKMYLSLYADETSVSLSEPLDYPIGEWATYTLRLDLDNLLVTFSVNGTEIITTDYTAPGAQFGGADLWKFDTGNIFITGSTSTNDPCEWYIDDVMFVEGELSTTELNGSTISVYPTLANEVINVTAKSNISEVSVYNMNGQQVAKVAGNGTSAQVNVSALPAGTYVVKTVAGKEVKSTKVVVK